MQCLNRILHNLSWWGMTGFAECPQIKRRGMKTVPGLSKEAEEDRAAVKLGGGEMHCLPGVMRIWHYCGRHKQTMTAGPY